MSSASEGPRSPGDGVRPSPNIWFDPAVYELENSGVDPDAVIWTAMSRRHDWAGRDVLDVGCGTGYHLPHFARTARRVIGVEPHVPLAAIARRRTRRLANVEVREGTAAGLPVPDASIDVMHARWAYFFGPGAEPGLAELDRVMRPGGVASVIDNDPTRSTFGGWFRRGYPDLAPAEVVEGFWRLHGWHREPLLIAWRFATRADFEAVVRIEFPTDVAEQILAEEPDRTGVDYAVNLWWKRF